LDTSILPKTRAEAKATGAAHYFTGEPCKHGHVAPRKTKGACVECLKVEWALGNEKRAVYFATYNKSAAGQAAKQRYYEANKDAVKARAIARPTEDKRRYQEKWASENVVYARALTKARRRKHRLATPKWLKRSDVLAIRHLYQIAITMTKTTGEAYVVDHIIPLQHEDICGLHVPWNLRVITRKENLLKSNKIPPEDMYLAWPKGA
jgi:5-methylcytosine-specific restriction endonuclease McrA